MGRTLLLPALEREPRLRCDLTDARSSARVVSDDLHEPRSDTLPLRCRKVPCCARGLSDRIEAVRLIDDLAAVGGEVGQHARDPRTRVAGTLATCMTGAVVGML